MIKNNRGIINIFLLLALLLSACAPRQGVFDVALAPAEETRPASAALDRARPLAIALLAGLPEDRLPFFHFQNTTCTQAEAPGGVPHCRAGEAEGMPLRVFPIGGREENFLRSEEIGQVSDLRFGELVAVYHPTPEDNARWPQGDLALLFEHREDNAATPLVARVQDGRLVGIDFPAGPSAQAALEAIPVAAIVLSPEQAQAWSAPLRGMSIITQSTLSDDHQWLATSMVALPAESGGEYYHRLTVTSQENAAEWIVVDEWQPFDNGYSVPFPHAWSKNSATLFWTFTRTPEGCVVYSNGSDMNRLDLVTGSTRQLMAAAGLWVALSPDEGRVAAAGPDGLLIHDLNSGARRSAPLPAGQPGQIIWSPDGRSVALTVAHEPCSAAELRTTSVLLADAATLETRTLVDHDRRGFATLSWSGLTGLQLADRDGIPWNIDPKTGVIASIAGQPTQAGDQAPSTTGTMQIRFFTSAEENDRGVIEQLARQFSEQYPAYQIVFTQPPDIDYDHYQAGEYLGALNESSSCFVDWSLPNEYGQRPQLLLDLAPLAAAENPPILDDFLPNQLAAFQEGNRVYALPLTARPELIGFNLDLLERLGIAAPNEDWASPDFIRLIQQAAERGKDGRVIGFIGNDTNFNLLIPGLAGSIIDRSSRVPSADFTGPGFAAALGQLNALRDINALQILGMQRFANADDYAASQAWVDGRVAFWHAVGDLRPVYYREEQGGQPNYRIGYVPMPQMPAEAADLFRLEPWMMAGLNFYILKDSPETLGCWEWYKFLANGGVGLSTIPARRSLSLSPEYEAAAGVEKARVLRIGLERFYANVDPQPNYAAGPLTSWLYVAVRSYLDGADLQLTVQIAQRKADLYTACITPALDAQLTPEEITAQARECTRRVDPSMSW